MRILVYLVFKGSDGRDVVHASFSRSGDFNTSLWVTNNSKVLSQIGVKRIEFEEVPDDFYLDWEIHKQGE